ncbi:MAG: hypothetical protein ACTSWE_16580 [Promethearchaeota archaeon]
MIFKTIDVLELRINIFKGDFILFDFDLVGNKIFVKFLKYVPKGNFNQLKARFKENGGRIMKGMDSWQWILLLACEKKTRNSKEDRSILPHFFNFFY